jgi:hypothetical protein
VPNRVIGRRVGTDITESVIEFYSFTVAESVIESIIFTHKFRHTESFSFAVVECVRETLNFIHTFKSVDFVSET